tara:strand:- start:1026 stop:1409 length:384 start_codon:yes stop_codon:yes gene_type:complete
MGGGAPTIDGGMSEEQYRKLQMEEREFMAQQEERQMQLMNEQEDKRSQREAAEKQRQDRIRGKEEEALTEMERQISDQTEGFNLEADEEDKDIVMDFYGSLAENASPNAGGKKGGKGKTSGGSGRPQ